ncbi:uncharacterized protein TrAFT101_011371 [Trichoderma asperellum]|uniref:uncharacterized protein n=1 Tax=Trichoderma asperellum TaxID=101201 RepID=UPI003325D664|nr:hypothetical protein TrAFT101_011371 [Trichoderma asperellum]
MRLAWQLVFNLAAIEQAIFQAKELVSKRRSRANQESSLEQLQPEAHSQLRTSSTKSWMLQPPLVGDGFSAKTQLAQSSIHSKNQIHQNSNKSQKLAWRIRGKLRQLVV